MCPARVLTVLFAMAASLAASPTYQVYVVLPPAGFTNVSMSGINNSGQVAGYGLNGTQNQAFIGSPFGSTAVPIPAGWSGTQAYTINESGQIAGYAINGNNNNYQAFIGTGTSAALIPLPSGWTGSTFGYGINDSGQLAGYGGAGVQTFVGTSSGSTAIAPASNPATFQPTGINNSGEVVGFGLDEQNSISVLLPEVGSTSQGASVTGPFPDWVGVAINDSNDIVTFTSDVVSIAGQVDFLQPAGPFGYGPPTVIPVPTGATTMSAWYGSLNSLSYVVGSSDVGGWIWNPFTDTTQLLNTLVPPGWDITSALSISNNGIILAEGSLNGARTEFVELGPQGTLPEPASFLLAGGGIMLLGLARRVRKQRI